MRGVELDLQVVADVPVHSEADQLAATFLHVDGGFAILGQQVQAIGELAFVVELAAEIAVQVIVIPARIAQRHAAVRVVGGALEHVVDQATGRRRPVQKPGKAGDDLQLFGFFEEVTGVGQGRKPQAVVGNAQVARCAEPPDVHGTGITRPCGRKHLGEGVAFKHVIQRSGLRIFQKVLRRHAHGIGCVLQFHPAQRADIVDVFTDITCRLGPFGHGRGVDVHIAQGQGAFFNREQGVRAAASLLQLQPAALQRLAQRRGRLKLAVDGRRGFACQQGRVDGQRDPGLTGDLVQGRGQRPGGQVVTAGGGAVFGSHQHAAGQRNTERNSDG